MSHLIHLLVWLLCTWWDKPSLLECTSAEETTARFVLQGLIHRGMSPRDMQQGWDVALTPTHLAVTLPTRVAAVYSFQVYTSFELRSLRKAMQSC